MLPRMPLIGLTKSLAANRVACTTQQATRHPQQTESNDSFRPMAAHSQPDVVSARWQASVSGPPSR